MKLSFLKYFFIFLVFIPKLGNSKNYLSPEDSLLNKLKIATTTKDSIRTYNSLIILLYKLDLKKTEKYYTLVSSMYKREKLAFVEANFIEIMGDAYWFAGNFKSAMDYYIKGLRIGDSLKDDYIIAKSKYNIGWIKTIQMRQTNQVFYLYDALKIFERKKDTNYIIQVYDALGNFYKDLNSHFKYANDSCIKYYSKNINLISNSKYKDNEAGSYSNIASFFVQKKDYLKAKEYCLRGISISKKTNDEYNLVFSTVVLADCYFCIDSISKSKQLLLELNTHYTSASFNSSRLAAYFILMKVYEKEKNYNLAYTYSLRHKALSDSINEETFNQNLLQKENDYKLEQKDKAFSELQLKNQLQTVKNKQNSYIIIGLIIFGILVVIILYFLSKSNKQKQQTNILLSSQNEIIKEKNKEIQQSMKYASRIQHALMPTQKYISSNLNRLKKK